MWFSVVLRMGKLLFTERMATDSGKTELDYAISRKWCWSCGKSRVSEITGAIIGLVVPPVTSPDAGGDPQGDGAGSSGRQCG